MRSRTAAPIQFAILLDRGRVHFQVTNCAPYTILPGRNAASEMPPPRPDAFRPIMAIAPKFQVFTRLWKCPKHNIFRVDEPIDTRFVQQRKTRSSATMS